MASIKRATTENVIRVNVQSGGHVIAGTNADGTVNVLIQSVVSAFGPKNLGNYYMLRVTAETSLPASFDLQNADSGIWLGTWEVRTMPGKAAKLWDTLTAKPAAAKPAAAATAAPAPVVQSSLIVSGTTSVRNAVDRYAIPAGMLSIRH
jgi:hypothetical protein